MEIGSKKAWFFHGDIFDVVMQYSKWLAKFGAFGYNTLIHLNSFINYIYRLFGKGKVSLSKKIKENVKTAVKYVNNFEETAIQFAGKKGYNYIVCGHIHHAEIKKIRKKGQKITYLNSGDWVENLTSLEYNRGKWRIYSFYNDDKILNTTEYNEEIELSLTDYDPKQLFGLMMRNFKN